MIRNFRPRDKILTIGRPVIAVSRSRGPSYDADALLWKAAVIAAGGTVSDTQLGYVSTLITAQKAASIWSLMDRQWLFASENAFQAKIDIKGLASATPTNTPTFTASQGYAGNGTSSYVDTGYTPSTDAVNYALNSGGASVYIRTNRTSGANKAAFGGIGAGNITLAFWPWYSDNTVYYDVNQTTDSSHAAPATVAGLWTLSRTAVNLTTLYQNGSSFGTSTTGPAASVPATNLWVGAAHAGTPEYSTDQMAIFAVHAGLNGTLAAALSTALNAYMTSLGTNVY